MYLRSGQSPASYFAYFLINLNYYFKQIGSLFIFEILRSSQYDLQLKSFHKFM